MRSQDVVEVIVISDISLVSVLSIERGWRTKKTKSGASSVSRGNTLEVEVTLCLEIMRLKIKATK
jgi:hypothetical protein